MGCVQCKDKEATKLTDERDGSLTQSSGYRYGTDPTPQHYPSFGVTSIPNYNNFHATGGQGLTVFGGVNSSSHTGTLRTRGGTGELEHLILVLLVSVMCLQQRPDCLSMLLLGRVISWNSVKNWSRMDLGPLLICKFTWGWEIMCTCQIWLTASSLYQGV